MLHGEFNLGQMLRDADIFSVEDLENALRDTQDRASLRDVIKQEATWSSFKQLLTTDLRRGSTSKGGRALQQVLERAGWFSAEQIGLVLEAIDQYGEGLGQRLLQAGLLSDRQLRTALERKAREGKSLWRVLINAGFVDLMQICTALKIEDRILGQMLVTQALIDVKTLQEYLDKANHSRHSVARLLVEDGRIDANVVARCWGELYNLPYQDLMGIEPPPELRDRFTPEQLSDYLMLPIAQHGNRITVALGTPAHAARLKAAWSRGGHAFRAVIAPIDQMLQKIGDIAAEQGETRRTSMSDQARIDPDATPAEIVDACLRRAHDQRGTALHFDPGRERFYVRVRVDGVLHELVTTTTERGEQVTGRLRVLANLDGNDGRKPTHGHLVTQVGNELLSMHISTMPTRYGEKTVLRLIDQRERTTDFSALGMSDDQVSAIGELLGHSNGLLLFSGPVSSGRTTTMHCAMGMLNVAERSLVTLEDPTGFALPRVTPIELPSDRGLSWNDSVSAMLRQDPDVIAFGEICDPDSAAAAVRAALSGVLVLGSIHAPDAVGVVDALVALGVSRYRVANCLLGAVSQRLARRLCPECSEPHEPDASMLHELGLGEGEAGRIEFRRGQGCPACLGTGFRGRTGIFEVLAIDEVIRERIVRDAGKQELREAAIQAGMSPMVESGLGRVASGETTPEELWKSVVL